MAVFGLFAACLLPHGHLKAYCQLVFLVHLVFLWPSVMPEVPVNLEGCVLFLSTLVLIILSSVELEPASGGG
ncbi:hypothetical protein NQZ68_022287 [Dissostichus eleginoides]|nr:hypothetical protein NQZ68_022287 [Dissostichus eleginoides]